MYHDTPQQHVFDKIEANLYEKPFGESVIGTANTVGGLKRDFVFNFFKNNYSAENFIVTIVGNVDFEKICDYLGRNFSGKGLVSKEFEIKKKNDESTEEREGIDQAHFVFGIHAPLMKEKNYYALEILNAYLASGMSSKLFLKIREEKGLAYAVKGGLNGEKNYSYYTIYVGTTKEALPEVKKIILQEFANVSKMSEKELEEAKEQVIGLKKVSSEESINVMNELMFHEINGRAEDYYDYEKKIGAVKLEDVKKLAKIKDYSIAAIVPK